MEFRAGFMLFSDGSGTTKYDQDVCFCCFAVLNFVSGIYRIIIEVNFIIKQSKIIFPISLATTILKNVKNYFIKYLIFQRAKQFSTPKLPTNPNFYKIHGKMDIKLKTLLHVCNDVIKLFPILHKKKYIHNIWNLKW